jgi:glycine/D-amino acid oxidase-like deaminating enzyme
MKLFSAKLSRIGLPEAKSGLRTMSPDGRFIIGEDGKLKDFYWVAGLGGHGVTSCFSAGELAADQVLGRAGSWKRLAAALSPERFLPARAARIAEGALYVA